MRVFFIICCLLSIFGVLYNILHFNLELIYYNAIIFIVSMGILYIDRQIFFAEVRQRVFFGEKKE